MLFKRIYPNYTQGDIVIGKIVDFRCGYAIFDTGDIVPWPSMDYVIRDNHNRDNWSRDIMIDKDVIAVWWVNDWLFEMEFVD